MLVDILGRELVSDNLVIWDLNNNDKDVQGRYGLIINSTKMYTLSKGFCNYDTTDCICYAITTPTSYEIQIYNLLKQSYTVKLHNSMSDNLHKIDKSSSKLDALRSKVNFGKQSLNVGDVFEANNGLCVIYLGKAKLLNTYNAVVEASGYSYLVVTKSWLLRNYFDLSYYLQSNSCMLSSNKKFFDRCISVLPYEIKDKEVINHVNIESGRYTCSLVDNLGLLGQYKLEIRN